MTPARRTHPAAFSRNVVYQHLIHGARERLGAAMRHARQLRRNHHGFANALYSFRHSGADGLSKVAASHRFDARGAGNAPPARSTLRPVFERMRARR